MRVVELVAPAIAHPQPPATDRLPAHTVQGAVRDRHHRRADVGEDVVAVVPVAGNIGAEGAVAVPKARPTGNREDVTL
jgi:hypothetical protein